jgi:Tol biopolymer transport system component
MDTATGREQQITSPYQLTQHWGSEGRYENASDWSADGKWIVATGARYAGGQGAIALLPLSAAPQAERQARVVTSDARHSLYQATISADDRWIAFRAMSTSDERVSTLHVVARSGGAWIQVTDGSYWDSDPHWSPDGRMIYFISSRGLDTNVWGVRFDPAEGRPVGDVFRVTSVQGPRRVITGASPRHMMDLAVAHNRLVLGIRDVTGGIWILNNVDR